MSDLAAAKAQAIEAAALIEAAMDEVIRICSVDQSPRMSIPANPKRDTDLILMDALKASKDALASLLAVRGEADNSNDGESLQDWADAGNGTNWGGKHPENDANMERRLAAQRVLRGRARAIRIVEGRDAGDSYDGGWSAEEIVDALHDAGLLSVRGVEEDTDTNDTLLLIRDARAWTHGVLTAPGADRFIRKLCTALEARLQVRWLGSRDHIIETIRSVAEYDPDGPDFIDPTAAANALIAASQPLGARVQIVLDSLLSGLSDCEPDYGDYEISGRWVYDTLTGKGENDD